MEILAQNGGELEAREKQESQRYGPQALLNPD